MNPLIPRISARVAFEPRKITEAVERRSRAPLSRAGAFVWRRMRSSIRRRRGVSMPGKPPSDHGGALRRLMRFAVDTRRGSVHIGPLFFRRAGSTTGAALLEFGGSATGTFLRARDAGRDGGGRFQKQQFDQFTGTVRYAPRPYALPALRAEAPRFPRLFRGAF